MNFSVYDAWYPEMYSWMVADAERSRAVASFVLSLHPESVNRRLSVLDAGCGVGQIAAALALDDAKVYAVDNSSAMVAVAKEMTADMNVQVIEADFASECLQSYGPFDIVACLFNTYGHPSVHSPAEILRSWNRCLAPNGVIYVEFPRLESTAPGVTHRETELTSGVTVRETRSIDYCKQTCDMVFEFSDGREDVSIGMDLFSTEDVNRLAERESLEPRFWKADRLPYAGVRGSHCVSFMRSVTE